MSNVYCISCGSVTEHRHKMDAEKNGCVVCNECDAENLMCSLHRLNDGLIKTSKGVKFIEFEDGVGKALHDKPEVGFGVIMSPFSLFMTWQTTEINEIIVEKDNYIKFKTKNSEYELYINK